MILCVLTAAVLVVSQCTLCSSISQESQHSVKAFPSESSPMYMVYDTGSTSSSPIVEYDDCFMQRATSVEAEMKVLRLENLVKTMMLSIVDLQHSIQQSSETVKIFESVIEKQDDVIASLVYRVQELDLEHSDQPQSAIATITMTPTSTNVASTVTVTDNVSPSTSDASPAITPSASTESRSAESTPYFTLSATETIGASASSSETQSNSELTSRTGTGSASITPTQTTSTPSSESVTVTESSTSSISHSSSDMYAFYYYYHTVTSSASAFRADATSNSANVPAIFISVFLALFCIAVPIVAIWCCCRRC